MCYAAEDVEPMPSHKQHENRIIWTEARDTMASRAALSAEMQVATTSPPDHSCLSPVKHRMPVRHVTFSLQLVLSLDSVTGAPLSRAEWSLLNLQTSNCPNKFGAIMFVPCLLGVLPPTTAAVFHHGPVNDARATRVQILTPCPSSAHRVPPGALSSHDLHQSRGCIFHILTGLGPLPVNLSPAPSDDFYISRAVVAVDAKRVRCARLDRSLCY
jgi:hypothetical protein